LRAAAAFWDLPTFGLLAALLFLVGDFVRVELVWFAEVLLAIFYGIGLLATQGMTNQDVYAWYLATKTKSAGGTWRAYWFWKFRYQVTRHLRRAVPRAGRDLFFKQQVRRFAAATGESIPTAEVPGYKDIMRTVRQSVLELRVLRSEKGRRDSMSRDVRVLADYVSRSETLAEAFLLYAASMYLTLDPADRALVRLEAGTWAKLTKDPVLSRILVEGLTPTLVAVVVALVVHYLR